MKNDLIMMVTGHRPNKLGNDYTLQSPLIKKIKTELQRIIDHYNPDIMISGMALGIDTLWAQLALENKKYLICAIPFLGQEALWPDHGKLEYTRILHLADEVEVVSQGGYEVWKMQARNQWMVDRADIIVAVWDGSLGGTANCVKYAKNNNKQIIYINPKIL